MSVLVIAEAGVNHNGSMEFAKKMAELCSLADIIVPNFTEAAFMTGEKYKEGPYTKEYVERIIKKLSDLGPKKIVLTGVYFDDKQLGCACCDTAAGEIEYCLRDRLTGVYHGTGDVFASTLCGALLNDMSLKAATQTAAKFTCGSIERTLEITPDVRYGVAFEGELPRLIKELKRDE